MTSRRRNSKKTEPTNKPDPKFKRGDLVQLIGIPSPNMLVSQVANEPEEPDDDDDEEEDGLTSKGEYTVTVIWFNTRNEMQGDYGGQQFSEKLLQLVKPAEQVFSDAETATANARGY